MRQINEKRFFLNLNWNCIRIGIIKLSLIRRGYISSAANVLTNSSEVWNIKNRDIFQLIWLGSNQWSPKTLSDKCLKSPNSKNASTSYMVNMPKHYWYLHHYTFMIFIIIWLGNYVRKSLSYWQRKSWHCLIHPGTDEKYPVLNIGNLTIPIQMQLSQKTKTFSQFFAAFWKSRLNFEYFEKKYDPHRFCISKVTTSKNLVR